MKVRNGEWRDMNYITVKEAAEKLKNRSEE